jgi:hypothetical protein
VSTNSPARGRSGRLAPGQAPPVSAATAAAARANLKRKLAVYDDWAKYLSAAIREHAQPPFPIEGLPLSQNKFNDWTSASFDKTALDAYGTFGSNSNSTLNGNEDLKKEFLALKKIIKSAVKTTPEAMRSESMASLRRRLTLAQDVLAIAENALARARVELAQSQRNLEAKMSELRSTEDRAVRDISALEEELAKVTAERASLSRSLRNLAPLARAAK